MVTSSSNEPGGDENGFITRLIAASAHNPFLTLVGFVFVDVQDIGVVDYVQRPRHRHRKA